MTQGGVTANRQLSRFALAWWGLVLGLLSMVAVGVFCVVVTSMSLVLIGIGIPLVLVTVPWLRRLADWHRWWLAEYLGVPVARPY
ncbi:MAG TPA: sensor domain-containing protein, partial [Pseudonocardiaceae bacterium]|nr:sensor domain-containing protein [Pseudonocardiaceae bacterium]